MPSIREDSEGDELCLQQDGTPQLYYHDVRSFLDEILTNMWIGQSGFIEYPMRSPRLTPLDCFMGHLKDTVYAMKPATVAELRAAIERKCTQIPRWLFSDVCNSIDPRRQQRLDKNGRQYEKRR